MSILALTLTIVEYLLLVVVLIAAVCIIVAGVVQKTGEDGLSSTIAGGQETYYGRDKSAHTDHLLFKLTKIAAIVFVVATVLAYVIQPDYSSSVVGIDGWKELTEFSGIFQ